MMTVLHGIWGNGRQNSDRGFRVNLEMCTLGIKEEFERALGLQEMEARADSRFGQRRSPPWTVSSVLYTSEDAEHTVVLSSDRVEGHLELGTPKVLERDHTAVRRAAELLGMSA